MNDAVLEKLRKMWENIKIFNLSQKKEEETIWCQNQIIILRSFSEKIISKRIEKKNRTYE